MSQENVPAVYVSDLTEEDKEKVKVFVDSGAKGFDLTDEAKITKMMDMYLAGKTYSQIARINRCQKELVMLYSDRLHWYPLKVEYLNELEMHLRGRLVNAKVANQDFLLQLSQMYQKKIGAKMDSYLQTNDEAHADRINLKEIDKYLKIVEALHKLSTESSGGGSKSPAVGINVGDGVTVVKKGENEVEITPKQKTIGSMLETLANQRRENEALKAVKTSDIKEKKSKTDGDKGNPNE